MTLTQQAGPAVRAYQPGLEAAWDDLVFRSRNGTFLHSRRFLAYHGGRFRDCSLMLEDRHGRLTGVFAAAEDPADPTLVVSHPGITYGGVVHDGSVQGASMISALDGITAHYRALGYRRMRYKAVPAIYHSGPADDDRYALFRLGACRYRCDLSVTIDLANRGPVQQRRARSRRRAHAAGVRTEQDWAQIAAFWPILELNLSRRHGVAPVHSLAEISLLHDLFPEEILLIAASVGEVPAGGAVLFAAGPVLHMQYTATTTAGRDACATDLVLEHAIALASQRGCRYFDFGTCTVAEGHGLDDDLYQFKAGFGGGGVVHEHYELDLQPGTSAVEAPLTAHGIGPREIAN